MAGNGPAPKDPSLRARRNKASTKATLVANPNITVPDLPGDEWHAATRLWWLDLWRSPMAPEYDESDLHGLFMLAALVNDFWSAETARERAALSSEIRLQRACFGLTPIDRRRLQWEIEKAEAAEEKGRKRRAKTIEATVEADDPRALLVG